MYRDAHNSCWQSQHAIAYVQGDKYYGAKATINVWEPKIEQPNEFSLSQLWILGGSFGEDLNSIEAGWQVEKERPTAHEFHIHNQCRVNAAPFSRLGALLQCSASYHELWNTSVLLLLRQVSPDLYGDNNTRLFTYWTVSFEHYYVNILEYICTSACHFVSLIVDSWLLCYLMFCRVMRTKQQGATTCCAPGSFRLTARLPWVPASSQPQATLAPNMISVYWSGRWASN